MQNEFITCYLGEVDENPFNETYAFNRINGVPIKPTSGLIEDYWFGHQIQHGSSNQVNVKITSGYIIKASIEIKNSEELLMDYNRSLFCNECVSETDFNDHIAWLKGQRSLETDIERLLCSEGKGVIGRNRDLAMKRDHTMIMITAMNPSRAKYTLSNSFFFCILGIKESEMTIFNYN